MNSYDYIDLFAIPILKTHISDEKLISRAEKSILEIRKTFPDEAKISSLAMSKNSLRDGTSNKVLDPLAGVDGADELLKYAKSAGLKYLEDLGANKKTLIQKKMHWDAFGWWNVFEEGEWYPYHDHVNNAKLSCVIYLRQEEHHTGLRMKHPVKSLISAWFRDTDFGTNTPYAPEVNIKCKTGDVIVFPPWIEHGVPYENKEHSNGVAQKSFDATTSRLARNPRSISTERGNKPYFLADTSASNKRVSVAIDLK